MTSDFTSDEGREILIDLVRVAAGASGSYANFLLTCVDDHVVRMSVIRLSESKLTLAERYTSN